MIVIDLFVCLFVGFFFFFFFFHFVCVREIDSERERETRNTFHRYKTIIQNFICLVWLLRPKMVQNFSWTPRSQPTISIVAYFSLSWNPTKKGTNTKLGETFITNISLALKFVIFFWKNKNSISYFLLAGFLVTETIRFDVSSTHILEFSAPLGPSLHWRGHWINQPINHPLETWRELHQVAMNCKPKYQKF